MDPRTLAPSLICLLEGSNLDGRLWGPLLPHLPATTEVLVPGCRAADPEGTGADETEALVGELRGRERCTHLGIVGYGSDGGRRACLLARASLEAGLPLVGMALVSAVPPVLGRRILADGELRAAAKAAAGRTRALYGEMLGDDPSLASSPARLAELLADKALQSPGFTSLPEGNERHALAAEMLVEGLRHVAVASGSRRAGGSGRSRRADLAALVRSGRILDDPALAGITAPVLVVVGDDDEAEHRRSAEALATVFPNCSGVVALRGAGQLVPLDAPVALAEALVGFFLAA